MIIKFITLIVYCPYIQPVLHKAHKILSIQYLRGLAALGVVLCHFGVFTSGQIGVHVFFFISGFIIVYSLEKSSYKPDQFFTFLIKRSIRIDPPYWATIALYIALGFFLNNLSSYRGKHFELIPGQLFAHMLYAVPLAGYQFYNHIFWTLSVEFQFYILIGLLYFLSDNKIYRVIFLIALGVANLFHYDYDGFIFSYSAIFALGISFMMFCGNRTQRNVILPASFICLIAFCHGFTVAIVLFAACIAVLAVNVQVKSLYFLGNISYSLYLTHGFVAEVCNGIFKRIAIAQFQLLCFSIELTVAILFAWLFYYFIEKPSVRLSKKFIYQRTLRLSVKG